MVRDGARRGRAHPRVVPDRRGPLARGAHPPVPRRSARPSSTRIRTSSSTATSSPGTSSSRTDGHAEAPRLRPREAPRRAVRRAHGDRRTALLTPEYASPEQVRGETDHDRHATSTRSASCSTAPDGRPALPHEDRRRAPSSSARSRTRPRPPPSRSSAPTSTPSSGRRSRRSRTTVSDRAGVRGGPQAPSRRAARSSRAATRSLTGPGKFLRRHRLVAAAAAAVFVSLAGGAGVALWQARVARRSEALARQPLRGRPFAREHRPLRTPRRDRAAAGVHEGSGHARFDGPALSRRARRRRRQRSRPGAGRRGRLRSPRSRPGRPQRVTGRPGRRDPEPPRGDPPPRAPRGGPGRTRRGPRRSRRRASRARDPSRSVLTSRRFRCTRALSRSGAASLARDPSSRGARRALARSCDAVADFHAARKDWAAAVPLREEERALFQAAAGDPAATDNDRRNLALSDKTLGALYEIQGRSEEPSPSTGRRSRSTRRAWPRIRPRPTRRWTCPSVSDRSARLSSRNGTRRRAGTLYPRALALREAAAAADPANVWARSGVARAHERLAAIEESLGHREAAAAHRAAAAPRS